jgi:hypothetical protein
MLATEKKLESLMKSDDLQSGRWTKEVKVLTILFAKNPARPGNSILAMASDGKHDSAPDVVNKWIWDYAKILECLNFSHPHNGRS